MTSQPNGERRACFRCRGSARVRLRLGDRELSGWLVDESAGGFGVIVAADDELAVGLTLLLTVKGFWWQVRVANILPSEDPAGCDTATSVPEDTAAAMWNATNRPPALNASDHAIVATRPANAPTAEPTAAVATGDTANDTTTDLADGAPTVWLRLGLARLAEVAPPGATPRAAWPHFDFRLRRNGAFGLTGYLLGVALTAGVLFAVILLGQSWFDRQRDSGPDAPRWNWPRSAKSSRYGLADVGRPSPSADDARASWIGGRGEATPGDFVASAVDSAASAGDHLVGSLISKDLRATIRQLPGASAMIVPEVANALQLTADQRSRIQRIVDGTIHAIQQMDEYLTGESRHELAVQRESLLADSLVRALAELTESQRRIWRSLIGETTNDASAAAAADGASDPTGANHDNPITNPTGGGDDSGDARK